MAIESQGVTPILEYISFLFLFLVMLNEGGVIRDYFQQFMTSFDNYPLSSWLKLKHRKIKIGVAKISSPPHL